MIFYTADQHLGHANVIKFDNRPFSSVDEMDNSLIQLWNSRISGNNDDVFIVGDLVFKSNKAPSWYLSQLKGRKHLVIGNHDSATLKDKEAMKLLDSVDKMMHVSDNGKQICLCHYPLVEWNGYFRGSYHIYGHIHNNLNRAYKVMKEEDRAFNAGCMITNYMPVTFDELVKYNKIFKESH